MEQHYLKFLCNACNSHADIVPTNLHRQCRLSSRNDLKLTFLTVSTAGSYISFEMLLSWATIPSSEPHYIRMNLSAANGSKLVSKKEHMTLYFLTKPYDFAFITRIFTCTLQKLWQRQPTKTPQKTGRRMIIDQKKGQGRQKQSGPYNQRL